MTTTIMMMACQHLVPIFEVTKRPVHCVRANSATTIISPPTVLIRTAIIKQGFEVPFSVSQNHGRNGLDNGDRPWVLANIICHPVPWVSGCHYNGWWQLTYSSCHMLSLSFDYKKMKKEIRVGLDSTHRWILSLLLAQSNWAIARGTRLFE